MENDQLILNRYKPLTHAGSGGFGSVVVAWDTRIQRKVAIKTIQLSERDVARAALPGANAVSARFAPVRGRRAGSQVAELGQSGAEGRLASGGDAEPLGGGRGVEAQLGNVRPAGSTDSPEPLPWESDEEFRLRSQAVGGGSGAGVAAAGTEMGPGDAVESPAGVEAPPAAGNPQKAHPSSASLPRPGRYTMQAPDAAYSGLGDGTSVGDVLADAPLTWAVADGTVVMESGRAVLAPKAPLDSDADRLGQDDFAEDGAWVARGAHAGIPGTLVMERGRGLAGAARIEGDELDGSDEDDAVDPALRAALEAAAQEPELGPDGLPLVRALAHVPGLDEARAAATLTDESIVGVYDFEIRDTTAYLIMEYVEGLTLTQFVSVYDSTLTLDMIAAVLQAVSRALGVAHENGVLHLDIKPDNVLINAKGQVKVTDFGLATLADASGQGVAGGGTIGYMPLEQMRQQPLDVRCDEWALASMMYWLLAGSNPFLARDLSGAEAAIENAELVLPSLCWEDMDPALDDVVFQALDPEAGERFESVAEFSKALKPFLGSAKKGKKQLAELVDAELRGEVEEEEPEAEEAVAEPSGWAAREPGLPLCYRITPWHRAVGAAVAGAAGSGVLSAAGWALMPATGGLANPLFWGLSGIVALIGALAPWVGALVACLVLGVGLVVSGAPALGIVFAAAGIGWSLYCGREESAQANAGLSFSLAGAAGFGMLSPLVAGFTARPLRAAVSAAFSCLLALTLSSIGLAAAAAGKTLDGAGGAVPFEPVAASGLSTVPVVAPALPLESYDLPAALTVPTELDQAVKVSQAPAKRQAGEVFPEPAMGEGANEASDTGGDGLARAFDDVALNDAGSSASQGSSSVRPVEHRVMVSPSRSDDAEVGQEAQDAQGEGAKVQGAQGEDAQVLLSQGAQALLGDVVPDSVAIDVQGALFVQVTAPQTWAVIVSWLVAAAVLALARLRRSRAMAVSGVAAAAVVLGVGICAAAFLEAGSQSVMPSPWSMASLVVCTAIMLVACAAIPLYGYTDDTVDADAEAEPAV